MTKQIHKYHTEKEVEKKMFRLNLHSYSADDMNMSPISIVPHDVTSTFSKVWILILH